MIIDGKGVAKNIENSLKEAIGHLKGRKPALAFVLVGDDPASIAFIRMKKKKCHEVGILSVDLELPSTISEEYLLGEIERMNQNPQIDGILVQLPLPGHIKVDRILEAIDPTKDVDGFHPLNMGRLLLGEKRGFFPCTPYGISILLHRSGISVAGKHVVILGRSNIVGKPLAALLMQKEKEANATVTIAHSASENLHELCLSADVLVAAIGKAGFVKGSMVKKGAVVVDVGINRVEGKIVGDVDFDEVAPKCSHITPVPGGVGPMTIAMLLSNTLLSYQRKQ